MPLKNPCDCCPNIAISPKPARAGQKTLKYPKDIFAPKRLRHDRNFPARCALQATYKSTKRLPTLALSILELLISSSASSRVSGIPRTLSHAAMVVGAVGDNFSCTPIKPASKPAAMAKYGFASEPLMRFSTRMPSTLFSSGTRKPIVRLLNPQ